MAKNKSIQPLCFMATHNTSSSSQPSSASVASTIRYLSSLHLEDTTLSSASVPPTANTFTISAGPTSPFPVSPTSNQNDRLQKASEHQFTTSCCLSRGNSTRSAVYKEGAFTPITPMFPPEIRANSQNGPSSSKVRGREEISSRMDADTGYFSAHCGTPFSFCESSPPQDYEPAVDTAQVPGLGTYASLSNLPTPPLSDPSCSPVLFPDVAQEDLDSSGLLGPAHYLASLIPPAASASPPSITLLQRILHRFGARREVIALAGIILDTLSSHFVRKWRTELARLSLWEDGGNKCEVLALTAVGLAMKWYEDSAVSLTAGCLSDISGERFCPREINVSERLMLQDLGYSLGSLCCKDDIEWALNDIDRWTRRISVS